MVDNQKKNKINIKSDKPLLLHLHVIAADGLILCEAISVALTQSALWIKSEYLEVTFTCFSLLNKYKYLYECVLGMDWISSVNCQ